MIDVENQVYSAVRSAVMTAFPNATVSSGFVSEVRKFPCVTIMEKDNRTVKDTMDSGGVENYASVMYEVNVYSNKSGGAKSECRSLAAIANDILQSKGFVRTMFSPIPNLLDATVFRITMRFEGVVSTGHVVYQK